MTTTFISGRGYIEGGWRCVLAQTGWKWTRVVFIDDGNMLRVSRVKRAKFAPPKHLNGYDEPQTMARAFLKGRAADHMTKGAANICRAAMTNTTGTLI